MFVESLVDYSLVLIATEFIQWKFYLLEIRRKFAISRYTFVA